MEYIANDGTRFQKRDACVEHEGYLRGQREKNGNGGLIILGLLTALFAFLSQFV